MTGGASDPAAGLDLAAIRAAVSAHARDKGCEVRDEDLLSADLGYDSLAKVELAAELEERLGISVPDMAVTRSKTVADLIANLADIAARPRG